MLRWILSASISHGIGKFWVGTVFVNIIGCFVLFALAQWIQGEDKVLQYFWKIGFLGSLTTFSTFSYEVVMLIKLGRYFEAFLVGFLNIFFGIIIGIWILR